MRKLLAIALLGLLSGACYSETAQVIGPFKGINNTDDPLVICAECAQDLLNVEIAAGGKSIKRRKGYGLAYALTTTTSPVHGVYSFYDASGNDVALAFNDNTLTASVAGGTPAILFSTGTVGDTWQCTDSLGWAYCASSSRQPIIKTNGATYSQVPAADTGTMVTATTQRLAMAGFSGNPSQIRLSKANDFATWATGPETTDPYFDTISAPGSRITHITFACGNLTWFKDASFGFIIDPDDQFNAQVVTVSPTLGTLDNSSVYYNGLLFFRAQDGDIYQFDCSNLALMTGDLEGTISGAASRSVNSWTQTSQGDLDDGSASPAGTLSFTISPGDVVPSSFTAIDTADADFNAGVLNNTSVSAGSVVISTNNTNPSNGGFETGDATNWSASGSVVESVNEVGAHCAISKRSGSYYLVSSPIDLSRPTIKVGVQQCSDNAWLSSVSFSLPSSACAYVARAIPMSGIARKCVFLSIRDETAPSTIATSYDFIASGKDITFYTASDDDTPPYYLIGFDDFTDGVSTIVLSSFTSRAFDTALSTPYYVLSQANWAGGTVGAVKRTIPTFGIQYAASANGPWTTITNSTGTSAISFGRYLHYVSTISQSGDEDNNLDASLDDITLVARSSGSYYSAVHPAPNFTTWDTLTVNKQDDGGSHSFYVRASSQPITVLSSTPSWTSAVPGGVITASTGAYVQLRDDFAITAATQAPTLNDFTLNWFEGAAADKAYGTYFDDAIWWAITYGDGATANNRILRYELDNQDWTIYDLAANGFYVRNNSLYFGSSSSGNVYKFGDSDSDAGAAINAYWKSKDFIGDSPLTEKEFRSLSIAAKSVANSTVTVTYTLDQSSSTSYSAYLYDSASGLRVSNRNLPLGRTGSVLSVQVGNNAADQPWEVFGMQFTFQSKPWRPR